MIKKGKNPLFLFNGEALPSNPQVGYLEENEQLVKGTRNTRGQTIAQPINRRINKFNNIVFPILTLEDYNWLKKKVADFEVLLTYYDSDELDVVIRRFYFGNLSGEPSKWENYQSVQKPIEYKNVKVNIIDMGY